MCATTEGLGFLTMGSIMAKHKLSHQKVRRGYDALFGENTLRIGGKRVIRIADVPRLEAEFVKRGWIKPEAVSA